MQEDQPKEEGFFTKIWNKTVFPDMIKDAKEEKAMKKELQKEARVEARDEIKEILKKQYIEKEKAKITGKGKGANILKKLGDEFKEMGNNVGNKDIGAMMGMGGGSNQGGSNQGGSIISDEKITNMMGGTPGGSNQGGSIISDEKITNMMGGTPGSGSSQQGTGIDTDAKIKRMLGK